jgi:hypothetical protein
MRRELSRNAYTILAGYQMHKANIMTTPTLNIPKGLGNHMKLLIEEALGQYYSTNLLTTPRPHCKLTHVMPQNALTDILGRVSPSLIGTAKAVVKSFIE